MQNMINSNEPFQDFSKSDYTLHWSWSNFFRHIAVCNAMLDLPEQAKILEIGAADSPIETLLKTNFNKNFNFTKTEVNSKYSDTMDIFDVASDGLLKYYDRCSFDCIIFTEVIEHIDTKSIRYVLKECESVLKTNGLFLVTTPTPQKPFELLVWPNDHLFEFSNSELIAVLGSYFKVISQMPWSMHLKDYEALSKDSIRLMPESLSRAFFSLTCDVKKARQIFVVCRKKRRLNETY